MSETEIYRIDQHVNFHFAVVFHGMGLGEDDVDARFQSVTGLDVQYETETFKEGGENRFEHIVPNRRKYSDLVLKRGIISLQEKSKASIWFKNAFFNSKVVPIDLDIWLLDDHHNCLIRWKVIHAWPKNWKIGELNADKGEVLIETLEMNYNFFELSEP